MELESIQSRTIYAPSINSMVRFATIEAPDNFAGINFDDKMRIDSALGDVAQAVFGVPRQHVVTFSRWRSISERLVERVNSTDFLSQLRQVYVGNDEELGKAFDNKIQRLKTLLSEASLALPDEKAFTGCALRNLVLNGSFMPRPTFKELSGLAEYVAFESLSQSLYSDLRGMEVDEILLTSWSVLSAAVNAKVLPSVKEVDRSLQEYELPLAASPKLEKLTVKELQAGARGCALICLGSAASSIATLPITGDYKLLWFVPIGIAGALIFVAITPLLPKIETYFSRVYKRRLK